jgi:hypothetical protein
MMSRAQWFLMSLPILVFRQKNLGQIGRLVRRMFSMFSFPFTPMPLAYALLFLSLSPLIFSPALAQPFPFVVSIIPTARGEKKANI